MKKQLSYTCYSTVIQGFSDSELAKGETKDCVVKSFATSFNLSYEEAHKFVGTHFKREFRKGTFYFEKIMNRLVQNKIILNGKSLKNIGKLIDVNGFRPYYSLRYKVKLKGKKVSRKMTVGKFIEKYPIGTYIVCVHRHAFTIKNGCVIGNPSDGKQAKKIITEAWKVVRPYKTNKIK